MNRTLTFFELQEWYCYEQKRIFVINKALGSFLKFTNSEKKLSRLDFQLSRKISIFMKKSVTRKLNWIKKRYSFVEHKILFWLI